MKKNLLILCLVVLAMAFTGCCRQPAPKYIFYFIGDGMGPNQISATEMYLAELQGRIGRQPLCFTQFPYCGLLSNFSASSGVTDSAAAGTALACGVKTTNHYLGVDSALVAYESVAAILKAAGWPVGITTSVAIDNATPAAFYAHTPERDNYYDNGVALIESGYDLFAGSTFMLPDNPNDSNDINLYDLAEQSGYVFARGMEQFEQVKDSAEKLILIQDFEGLTKDYKGTCTLPLATDKKPGDMRLQDIVRASIDFLLTKGDRFFVMVEEGAVDWAGHSNDAATALGETLELDSAVQVAYEFYLAHPDETLIVVTADHETGGMGLANSNYALNLQVLQNQKGSIGTLHYMTRDLHAEKGRNLTFDDVKNLLREQMGFFDVVAISEKEEAQIREAYDHMMANNGTTLKTLYQDIDEVANVALKILNKKSKLGWTTHGHTGAYVPVFAIGAGAEKFNGWGDNTDVPKTILSLTQCGK